MCVLSFVPKSDKEFVLTFNRDEVPDRPTLPPSVYKTGNLSLLYPKDEVSGGTWIGAGSNKRVAALMNGGFVPHVRKASYKMSRGLVLLDLLKSDDSIQFLDSFDFAGIEPFTVIMFEFFEKPKLQRIVWDEEILHVSDLPLEPKLMTSTPLYTPEMHAVRRSWLNHLLERKPDITEDDLWEFHHKGGDPTGEVPIIIEWDFIHTKSITQLIITEDVIQSRYHDLETDNLWNKNLELTNNF